MMILATDTIAENGSREGIEGNSIINFLHTRINYIFYVKIFYNR